MSAAETVTVHEKLQNLPAKCVKAKDIPELSSSWGPKWFTKFYMEKALRNFYKDNLLTVENLEVKPALGKGENYCGVLTRIVAEFKRRGQEIEKGFYILKTSFEGDDFANEFFEPFDVFNRELSIYETIIPKLKALLKEINDEDEIFAGTLAVDHEHSALIFEDLSVQRYRNPDRLKGLNKKLTKMALKKLAKMHAASAVLNERENHSLESYDRGMFNRYTNNFGRLFLGLLDACVKRISQWEDKNYATYAAKMMALKPLYMELANRVFDCIPGTLNVLTHGDLWTNNLLVEYDEQTGDPLDVLIIDFQYTAWGSPAIDLFYFLNSSLEFDLHVNHQTELIKYYYDVLSETLMKLNFRSYLPSLHKFHIELDTKEFYALHGTCFVAAVQRNEFTEDADFHALMDTDERAMRFKDTCYKNKHIQELLKHLLPIYDKRGLLEVNQ